MRNDSRRRHRREIAAVAAAILVGLGLLVATRLAPGRTQAGQPQPTATTTAPATTTSPATGATLAVKIDNVSAARPATGLGAAQVIYVEPVEAGFTRLVAVYTGTRPPMVGPVRSARRTDIDLLAQYGHPVLAYSGAAPQLLPDLHACALVNASPEESPSAYHRDDTRAAPHNLYLTPSRLPTGPQAPQQVLTFGAAPAGAVPTVSHRVDYHAASFTFTWSAAAGRWLIEMDGTAMTSTESGRLTAATVVEQRVRISTAESIEDAVGNVSPVAITTGQGEATVLRDGGRYPATWSRPTASDPTRFHTSDGRQLPLASGPVWILLVPA